MGQPAEVLGGVETGEWRGEVLCRFLRSVQKEAYDRGRRDGVAEGLLRGLEIDPSSHAGAVLASLVEEGAFP